MEALNTDVTRHIMSYGNFTRRELVAITYVSTIFYRIFNDESLWEIKAKSLDTRASIRGSWKEWVIEYTQNEQFTITCVAAALKTCIGVTKKTMDSCMRLLQPFQNSDSPAPIRALGEVYLTTKHIEEKHPEKAYDHYNKANCLGDKIENQITCAQFFGNVALAELASLYYTAQDYVRAGCAYARLAQLEKNCLTYIFKAGHAFFLAQKYEVALPFLEKASRYGSAEAQLILDRAYLRGTGYPTDVGKGLRLLEQLADQENFEASLALTEYQQSLEEEESPQPLLKRRRVDDSYTFRYDDSDSFA